MQFSRTQVERENFTDHRSLDHDSESHLDRRGSDNASAALLDLYESPGRWRHFCRRRLRIRGNLSIAEAGHIHSKRFNRKEMAVIEAAM
jgi:hypothetical protein